jgi:hypothetical protein
MEKCWEDLCKLVHFNPHRALDQDWETAVNRLVTLHMKDGAEDFIEYVRQTAMAYRNAYIKPQRD